jgi:hypothetical protein
MRLERLGNFWLFKLVTGELKIIKFAQKLSAGNATDLFLTARNLIFLQTCYIRKLGILYNL